MAIAPTVSTSLGVASALAMIGLGLAGLGIRPRTASSVAFSTFAIAWGGASGSANLASMSIDAPTGTFWITTFHLLYLILVLPLAWFVAEYPARRAGSLRRLIAVGAPVAAALVLFGADPALFVIGSAEGAGTTVAPLEGPLGRTLIALTSSLAFAVALAIIARRFFRASRGEISSQLGLVTAAFLTYVSYRAGDLGHAPILNAIANAPADPSDFLLNGAPALISSLACLGVAAWILWQVRARPDLPWRDLILACALIPFAASLTELLITAAGIGSFSSVGVWRLASVAIFAYAMARQRLFDIELRLRAASGAIAYVLAATVGIGLVLSSVGDDMLKAPGLGAFAFVGIALICVPARRLGPAVVDRLSPRNSEPDYLLARQQQVAEAAAEERAAPRYRSRDPERGGKFEIVKELGRGGGGRAQLARDTVLDRPVVLKQPISGARSEAQKDRFVREAKLAAKVSHPNVVVVHDVIVDPDSTSIVLEYVDGQSLETMLRGGKHLPPERALAIMRDVLDGLAAIHAAGILHRDLKPGNVLIDSSGRAKVTDFGVARAAGKDELGHVGFQPGSLAFMSPEQARGEPLDERSDVYSAAAVLYRMLAGRHYIPLARLTPEEARRRIATLPPEIPAPGIPAALEPIFLRALAKDRAARPASAAELRALLGGGSSAAPMTPPTRIAIDEDEASDKTIQGA